MKTFDEILAELSGNDNEQVLEVARMAELGMSASAVIHELRQPLTALSMSLQMTAEMAEGRDADLEQGLKEAVQLATKVELLLERARSFMSTSSEQMEFDLVELVGKVITVFKWQLGNLPNVTLDARIDESLPLLHGDRTQIEQLITNLVGNAVDAVREKESGKVIVHVDAGKEGNPRIVIADNGDGVDEENQARIFEPFFSTKGKNKGSGLGLYIVSKIAQRHGSSCRYMPKDELMELGLDTVNTGFGVFF